MEGISKHPFTPNLWSAVLLLDVIGSFVCQSPVNYRIHNLNIVHEAQKTKSEKL
jgi:hypothetical protein